LKVDNQGIWLRPELEPYLQMDRVSHFKNIPLSGELPASGGSPGKAPGEQAEASGEQTEASGEQAEASGEQAEAPGQQGDARDPAPAAAQAPRDKQEFLDDVARWTQAGLESAFIEVCRRDFPLPLRPHTLGEPSKSECPPPLQDMLERLEEFVRHSYPLRAETSTLMLKVSLIFGQNERALSRAKLLVAQENKNAEFLYHCALIFYRLQRFEDARKFSEGATIRYAEAGVHGQGVGDALFLQALSLLRLDKKVSAGHVLAGALSQGEADPALLRFALPCLREAREYGALMRAVKKLLELEPKDTDFVFELIRQLYADEEYEALAQLYELCPSLRSVLEKDDWYRFALALAWQDREGDARTAFANFLSPAQAPPSWQDLLRAVRESGRSDAALPPLIARDFLKRRKPEACLEYCASLPQPAGPQISLLMVHCHMHMGAYEEALALLEKLEYDAGARAEWHYLKGIALFFSGRKGQAGTYLEKAAEAGVHAKACWRLLGEIYSSSGDHERSADCYKKLAHSSGDDPEPVLLYAFAALRAGNENLALEGFRSLTVKVPDCAEGWNNLGVLLARREEYEAAARSFGRALECSPNLHEARKNFDLIREHVTKGRASGQKEWFANLGLRPGGGLDGSRNSGTG
jgi:tetratricopeptide (TPR) repeat protein